MNDIYEITHQEFFKNLYGDEVSYNESDDTYTLRGNKFYYRTTGTRMWTGKICDYILVDYDMPYIWLFTYGNREDRWIDYLEQKRLYSKKNTKRSFFKRLKRAFEELIG